MQQKTSVLIVNGTLIRSVSCQWWKLFFRRLAPPRIWSRSWWRDLMSPEDKTETVDLFPWATPPKDEETEANGDTSRVVESSFAAHLKRELPGYEVQRFRWSGANSDTERDNAAGDLKGEIKSRERLVLVAHSHGGNVAIGALQDKDARDKVVGLVCLSTPFLYAAPRSVNRLGAVLGALRSKQALYVAIAAVVLGPKFISEQNPHGWFWLGMGILLLAAQVVLRVSHRGTESWSEKLRSWQEELGETTTLVRKPCLCIQTAEDEAAWWLELWDVLFSLPYRLVHPFVVAAVSLPVFLLALRQTLGSWEGPSNFWILLGRLLFSIASALMAVFFAYLLIGMATVVLCFVVNAAKSALAFGSSGGFLKSFLFRRSISPLPLTVQPSRIHWTQSTLPFEHALHEDLTVRARVVKEIRRLCESSGGARTP